MNEQFDSLHRRTFELAQHGDEHAPAAAEHAAPPAHDAAHDAAHPAAAHPAAAHPADPAHTAEAAHPEPTLIKRLMPQEIPNIYDLVTSARRKDDHGGHAEHHHGPFFLDPLFSLLVAFTFFFFVRKAIRRRSIEHPGKAQVAVEGFFLGLMNFFGDILGEKHVRKYIPYIGTLWIYILLNNLFGLVPLFKSPTGHFQMTFALGVCTFFFVNGNAIKAGGVKHFFWHLAGAPTDAIGWIFSPLMFVLEVIGTFIKPISLSLRLWGNIMGEDRLLATFLGLGMVIGAIIWGTPTPIIGLPLHFPFFFLVLLGSTIQATVFSMLATVYLAMLLPHEHHHAEGHHHEDEGTAGQLDETAGHMQPPPMA